MNLKKYQLKARTTAIYLESEGSSVIYPILGLIGECGEVANKIKKIIRDSDSRFDDGRKKNVADELGDCCWYLANICCDTNLELEMMYHMRNSSITHKVRNLVLPRLVLYMNKNAMDIAMLLDSEYNGEIYHSSMKDRNIGIPIRMSNVLSSIQEIGYRCGFTLEEICDNNINKLLDRKIRGVLKGSGDKR